jgi:hypothetical protein
MSQPPGGRPTRSLQLLSRRGGWGSAALGWSAAKPAVRMVEAPSSFFTTEATEGHRGGGGQGSLEARGSIHFAASSVFESTHVEVDQQSDPPPMAHPGAAPLCPSVVKKATARRPRDVVSQPPGGWPALNLQLSSRGFGSGYAAGSPALSLLALFPPVKPTRADGFARRGSLPVVSLF